MVYDHSQQQSKQAVLNGLMSSKNISSLINDALKAPIGATSRKRAQKVVSLMRRYRANDMQGMAMDGAGGPGYQTIEQPNPMAEASQGELVIFPSPPEMRIPLDGAGGPGFSWTPPGSPTSPLNSFQSLQSYSTPSQPAAPAPTPPPGSGPVTGNTPYNFPGLSGNTPDPAISTIGGSSAIQSQMGMGNTQPPAPTAPTIPWNNLSVTGGNSPTPPGQQGQWTPMGSDSSFINSGYGTFGDQQGGGDTSGGTGTGGGTGGGTGTGQYSGNPSLNSSVTSGMGPDAFALSMLSNPDALRHLPGFADMPADAIPTGASLGGQIDTLEKTLRSEFNLDALLNQKNQMLKSGATLTMDLTDYIRGRDQFLNQTQGMIDSYQNKMQTMDLANPDTAARANQYMNYLYELKGRQNKRYIEFLNSSTSVYNAQLADVSNNYDKALGAYQSELQLKSSITQSEYQMYYTALTGMYNAAQQAPILAKQSALLDAQTNAANAAAAKDGAKNGSDGLLTDFNNIRTKAQGLIVDKDGNLLPTVNSLSGAINTLSGDGTIPASSAMQFMVSGMLNQLNAAPDASTASSLGSKYLGWAADLYKNAASETDATNATKLRSNIQGEMSSSIRSAIQTNTGELGGLRNDISTMLHPSWFSKGPDQATFTRKYSNLLGHDLANSLWAGVSQFKNDGGQVDLPAATNSAELSAWIADIASDSYVANIWNTALQQTQ